MNVSFSLKEPITIDSSSSCACSDGHVWFYGGEPFDGMLCACGLLKYKKKVCGECSNTYNAPIKS